jgi:hypothetical protein
MKFGTWNETSLHRPESLKASARELVKHMSDLQGAGSTGGPTAKRWHWSAEDYNCVYGKGHEYRRLGTVFSVHISS